VLFLSISCLIVEVAVAIIAELSFFLQSQEPFTTALNLYQQSPSCASVKEAVEHVFKVDKGHIFKENHEGKYARDVFMKQLVQIALDNRICMFSLYS
jgi:hypothetical protein